MENIFLDPITVGEVICCFRKKRRISQEVLSGFADIGRTHLSAIERGERKPTLETFFKICYAMDVKPHVVAEEIEKKING